MPMLAQCPEPEELQRFLLAQLGDAQARSVERHLLECGVCCETARRLTGSDTLVEAMRSGSTVSAELDVQIVQEVVHRLQSSLPSGAGTARMDSQSMKETANLRAAVTQRKRPESPDQPEIKESVEQRAALTREWTDVLAPPQGPSEIGRLGPFAIQRILGRGGMGVVFLALDPALNRLVALKVMKPLLAANEGSRFRFRRPSRFGVRSRLGKRARQSLTWIARFRVEVSRSE